MHKIRKRYLLYFISIYFILFIHDFFISWLQMCGSRSSSSWPPVAYNITK